MITQFQIIVYSLVFIFIFLVAIIVIKRKEIGSFFYPNHYVMVEMLELDNSVSSWIQEKNPDLRFLFNKGYYNLYHQSVNEMDERIISSSIYREGRLAKFFYHEGFSDPLDFRQGKITGNPQISRILEEINISSWFDEEENIAIEFFKKYGWMIVLGILIIVVYLLFKQGQTAPLPAGK